MAVPISSERVIVQKPFIRYAEEAGWQPLSPEEALRLRRGESSPLLFDIFVRKIQELNPGKVDHLKAEDLVKLLARVPSSIEGNLQAWEYLRGLKTVFVETERRERDLKLLDFEPQGRNAFHVTEEFSFTNGTYRIRADVAFLINGIPVLLIETKAATKIDGIPVALEQVRRYHREGPELLALLQLFGITHLVHFYYGATWSLEQRNVFNWKEESAGKDFENLVKQFVHPQRLLRIIRDFVLFTRKEDELAKVVLRPHQMRAVDRALVRAADPTKRRGLIWHTQGSGKTYTMIILAKRLIEEPAFQNPTVLMLVDRTELEGQLFGNLAATFLGLSAKPNHKPGYWTQYGYMWIAESKRGLQELLKNDTRGLVISMIHKFDDIPANMNKRKNILVLVDEAHRTTGGDLGNYLMGALPNATYLGFTGTPIDKTAHGKGTFKVFGVDDPKGYLDKYSIAESIEDGTTVPLYYSIAPNDLRVNREVLEREFLDLVEAQGMSDLEDVNRILEKAVTLRNMLKNPDRMNRVAQYVSKHFRENVEPMGYKAFVVAVDREACARYKTELDKYLPPEYSKVIISPGHSDPEELRQHHLSEEDERTIRKAFIKPDQLPTILIVTEKLLTGYDAPILYCMYLDKPMRDHVLLQAIARVNRPYEDDAGKHKPGGFVVDFVGIFENLEKALAFDSKDVQSVVEGLEVLETRFRQLMDRGRGEYLPLLGMQPGTSPDKAAESALSHFRDDETRQEYYRFFRELEDLYEIVSPNPFLRDFLDDYNTFAGLYDLLRAAYEGVRITDRELARKTSELVQKHTQGGLIREALQVYGINEHTLEEIARTQQPNTVKVFNLLKSVQEEVMREAARAPYLMSIGERAENIAEQFRLRQVSTEQALKQLQDLVNEINAARREQAQRNISAESFTVYWLLSKIGRATPEVAEKAAAEMKLVFAAYPHWRTSDSQARTVRTELYKALVNAGIAEVSEMVERIMTIVGKEPTA